MYETHRLCSEVESNKESWILRKLVLLNSSYDEYVLQLCLFLLSHLWIDTKGRLNSAILKLNSELREMDTYSMQPVPSTATFHSTTFKVNVFLRSSFWKNLTKNDSSVGKQFAQFVLSPIFYRSLFKLWILIDKW